MAQTLPLDDQQELNRWLLDNERKAILPFKWSLLLVTLFFWQWKCHWLSPEPGCFMVFDIYFLFLVASTYLLVMRRIVTREARAYCLFSFFLDIAYISLLIWCDNNRMSRAGLNEMSDYYYFYFILVMRGYSLSTSQLFNLAMNLLIVFFFVASFALSQTSYGSLMKGSFEIKLAFLWMIILMSWFIVGLINQQKAELMAARERLLKTQHLADLGELAAVVAHEVNNPIGIISANAEYMMKQVDRDDPRYEEFGVIRDESQRCKRIVTELLSYAQPSAGVSPIPVDLAALCREVVGFAFRRSKEREVRVNFEQEDDAPWVVADPALLRRALLNVLINARQAVKPEDGQIDVRVGRTAGAPAGASASAAPAMVEVTVSDNGPGIDPADVARAFEPFFTRKRGGTGLGLAVTRRVIESQNGSVAIAPRKGQPGTTVRLRLPSAS